MSSVLDVVVLLSVLKYLRCTFISITIEQAVSKHFPSFQAINVVCSFDVGLDHRIEQVRMHKSRKIADAVWCREFDDVFLFLECVAVVEPSCQGCWCSPAIDTCCSCRWFAWCCGSWFGKVHDEQET